jgi:cation transport ATPase
MTEGRSAVESGNVSGTSAVDASMLTGAPVRVEFGARAPVVGAGRATQ